MQKDTADDKLLLSRAEDALRIAEKRYEVKTLGFLTPRERMLLKTQLLPNSDMSMLFDGGYDEAERTLLVCFPEFIVPNRDEYLDLIECTGRDTAELSHRDYLGSLMGLGIVRESIGDILVLEDRAMFFVKPEITEYILQNLTKIGRCGVHLKRCSANDAEIPQPKEKEIETTVSSLRLDSIVSAAAGVSRSRSAELIQSSAVAVNWESVSEPSVTLKEGDVFSVRGFGRMKLLRIGGRTRKGRLSVTIVCKI